VLLPAAWRSGGILAAFELNAVKVDDVEPLPTFHARDVLAPAAAALACGVEPGSLGREIEITSLTPAPFGKYTTEGGYVYGEVLEADRFGSVRFNIPFEDLETLGLRTPSLEIGLGHNNLSVPFKVTFSDVAEGEPVVLVDSSGWLTLSVNMGNAMDRYGIEPGMRVRVRSIK
jgi:S-adenosylmethionine hydrolase